MLWLNFGGDLRKKKGRLTRLAGKFCVSQSIKGGSDSKTFRFLTKLFLQNRLGEFYNFQISCSLGLLKADTFMRVNSCKLALVLGHHLLGEVCFLGESF